MTGMGEMSGSACLRRHQHNRGEVILIASRVPREDAAAQHGGVGTDEEISQHIGAGAAAAPVLEEGTAGEEERRAREFEQGKAHAFYRVIERLHRLEGQRQLGINDGVDAQLVDLRLRTKLAHRPVGPGGVVVEHVDQDIGINQQHGAVSQCRATGPSIHRCAT